MKQYLGALILLATWAAHGDETDAGAARAKAIRDGFEQQVVRSHEACQAGLKDLIRVDFDLAPQLLVPGEETLLKIRARTSTAPNPSLEVWQDCYQPEPIVQPYTLDWKQDATDEAFTAEWKWRPPQCGNYLVHWRCDAGGDVPEFWRNVSVVDREWAVMILNSTSHIKPRPEPEFHRLHLPFSYWAESLLYTPRASAEDFASFSRNARQFGDDPGLLIFLGGEYLKDDKTVFYDEPESVQRAVLEGYRDLWKFYGFPRPLDSLYTYGMGNGPVRVARSLGIDMLGALCADQNWGDGPFKINHWGMPARAYFVSEDDFRRPGPGGPRAMVGIQQCERQTVLCRDYGCVYAFESAIAYVFNQYAGITRPRIVNDMILSREMDFLECFLGAAEQARQPYLFSCGIEFNGVWPDMAGINVQFMELIARRARTAKLAFTTAYAAADFMRRHFEQTPETTLYLPDVYAGLTHGGKPPLYPDTMEIENASLHAIFRRGEIVPYAQYDYTVPWSYPDWGNEGIPRKPDGYIVPNTDDRFRVTPPILDTRLFTVAERREEAAGATRITLTLQAEQAKKNVALAVWDIPRTFTEDASHYRVDGAKRFVPVRASYTNNLCGIVIADLVKGENRIEVAVDTESRRPATLDWQIGAARAKVLDRDGVSTLYLFAAGDQPAEITCKPVEGKTLSLYPFDSDEPQTIAAPTPIRLEPGKYQRIAGTGAGAVTTMFDNAAPVEMWTMKDTQ